MEDVSFLLVFHYWTQSFDVYFSRMPGISCGRGCRVIYVRFFFRFRNSWSFWMNWFYSGFKYFAIHFLRLKSSFWATSWSLCLKVLPYLSALLPLASPYRSRIVIWNLYLWIRIQECTDFEDRSTHQRCEWQITRSEEPFQRCWNRLGIK